MAVFQEKRKIFEKKAPKREKIFDGIGGAVGKRARQTRGRHKLWMAALARMLRRAALFIRLIRPIRLIGLVGAPRRRAYWAVTFGE